MRGAQDLSLLENPDRDLLREVTGVEPEQPGGHVRLDERFGVRSTQRLALHDVGGGIALLTWPAELVPQARFLYQAGRAQRLLAAAESGGWDVDPRPHLAYRNSPPAQRLYMNPIFSPAEYVARWAGPDGRRIGQHEGDTIRHGLWPWLREQGYASAEDERELEPFLKRLGRRPVHLRPALRLLRRWERDEAAMLRQQGRLAAEIRACVNALLAAVGDRTLPDR